MPDGGFGSEAAARAGRGPGRAARRCRRSGRTRSAAPAGSGELPPTSTVVSCSPATTCALVTTMSGCGHPARALDRQPAGGAEHAHDAARGARARPARARSAGCGAATSGEGPVIEGSGSSRASAFRIGPDGGSSSLSSRRIAERWMSARSSILPGRLRRARPRAIHTMPSAERRAERRAEQRRRAGPCPG